MPKDLETPASFPRPRRVERRGFRGCRECPTASVVFWVEDASLPAEGYVLTRIGCDRRRDSRFSDANGTPLRPGESTLRQLRVPSFAGDAGPAWSIRDRPDFPVRGYMLDVSRDRVPTRETPSSASLACLSLFRINHLQLYTEHTFAYAGSWRGLGEGLAHNGPTTSVWLDALVPRQTESNSFPTRTSSATWDVGSSTRSLQGSRRGAGRVGRHPGVRRSPLASSSRRARMRAFGLDLLRELRAAIFRAAASTSTATRPSNLARASSREDVERRGAGRRVHRVPALDHRRVARPRSATMCCSGAMWCVNTRNRWTSLPRERYHRPGLALRGARSRGELDPFPGGPEDHGGLRDGRSRAPRL